VKNIDIKNKNKKIVKAKFFIKNHFSTVTEVCSLLVAEPLLQQEVKNISATNPKTRQQNQSIQVLWPIL
jgi:hypothetical protein